MVLSFIDIVFFLTNVHERAFFKVYVKASLSSFFRQNKLEEALLFSGQFTDALQALIDWLYKVEPQLAEDQPVHGDIDLVMNLIDNHKVMTVLQ